MGSRQGKHDAAPGWSAARWGGAADGAAEGLCIRPCRPDNHKQLRTDRCAVTRAGREIQGSPSTFQGRLLRRSSDGAVSKRGHTTTHSLCTSFINLSLPFPSCATLSRCSLLSAVRVSGLHGCTDALQRAHATG
jgi:hypothetical protein